jgi:DNA (cytosine-5)-methyltransferase 1
LRYKTKPTEYLKSYALRNGIDILTQHVARPHREQDKKIYKIAVQKWRKQQERLNYNDLPEELKTHNNRSSFIDRFKVVAADLPYSQTVVAHISKDGHYYIHPDIEQNRSISVREAARLQSFPDDYYFEGEKEGANRTAAFKQIGNAVPPLMAKEIAKALKKVLDAK